MYRFTLILFLISFSTLAQGNSSKNEEKHLVKGYIIEAQTNDPMINTHVINLNKVTVTTTNSKGFYSIHVSENDTLYFSYVGFQSIKLKITAEIIKKGDLNIIMHESPIELEEITIKPYQLIGVLESDAKHVPIDKFEHLKIAGLPQTFETGAPIAHKYNTPLDAVFHPADFLYEMFGSKPKQLRRLKKLRSEDKLREVLEEKANREVLMEYLKMNTEQLNSLLDYCNYSKYFIKNASDLQVIEAILDYYENYKAIHKGSTKKVSTETEE